MLLSIAAVASWAQMEPCLTGIETQGCGIKVMMNPPLNLSDEKVFWVPNEITVEVPMRLHPTKVQLKSGPAGTETAESFKALVESAHYKKVSGSARFQMEVKNCPGADNALELYIITPKLPYPIAVNYQPFECKQRDASSGSTQPPPTK
jgi:hypothetical protein